MGASNNGRGPVVDHTTEFVDLPVYEAFHTLDSMVGEGMGQHASFASVDLLIDAGMGA